MVMWKRPVWLQTVSATVMMFAFEMMLMCLAVFPRRLRRLSDHPLQRLALLAWHFDVSDDGLSAAQWPRREREALS